jgi:hypothetical protein
MTHPDPGVHFRIDQGRRIIRILPEGDAPFEDITALTGPIREHPDFSSVFGRAWDLSAVTWPVGEEHVTELFEADRSIPRHPHGGKTAIIVDLDVYHVMARSHPHRVMGKEGRVRRVFPSHFEAEVWLLAPLFTPDSRGRIHASPEALLEGER